MVASDRYTRVFIPIFRDKMGILRRTYMSNKHCRHNTITAFHKEGNLCWPESTQLTLSLKSTNGIWIWDFMATHFFLYHTWGTCIWKCHSGIQPCKYRQMINVVIWTFFLALKWPRGSHGVLLQFFAYFTTIASNYLTGIICNCNLHGYASFDANKIK